MTTETIDQRKEQMNVNILVSLREWIDQRADTETYGNRSAAVNNMLLKLKRYEQLEADGRLRISKAA